MNKKTKERIGSSLGMHFSRSVTVAFLVFFLLIVFLWLKIGNYDAADQIAFQELMQSRDDVENNYTSRQHRVGVQKDVLYSENGQHLQLRLKSTHAELALDHHGGQTEVVENMYGVICYIQEELYYKLADGREVIRQLDGRFLLKGADPKEQDSWINPKETPLQPMQVVRRVDADTAVYYYKNSQFLAENVKVSRYVAAGDTIEQASISTEPLMDGVASWVEFSLGGKEINFKANQLKAKFYGPGRGL